MTTSHESDLPTTLASPIDGSAKVRFTPVKIAGLVGGVVVLLGAGIALSFALLSGGGAQPEDVLPRDTVAFAKVDFNPHIGQKIALVRFVTKFPKTFKNVDEKDPVGSLFNQFVTNSNFDWSRIKPWIGSRYAVAAVEDANGIQPVLVLEITNEQEMKYYFAKELPDENYVIQNGFAIISTNKSTLDLITSAPTHLSDNPQFKSDLAALGGDQIALIWADLKPIANYASDTINSLLYDFGSGIDLSSLGKISGRIALGFHVTPDSVVATFGTSGMGSVASLASKVDSQATIGQFPSNTLLALNLDGVGKAISDAIANNPDIANLLGGDSYYSNVSPEDYAAVLDGPLAIILLQNPKDPASPLVAIRISPANASKARTAVKNLENYFYGENLPSVSDGDYIYFGVDETSLKQLIAEMNSPAERLANTQIYKKSVTGSGYLAVFANLDQLISTFDLQIQDAPLGGLGIVGSVNDGAEGSSRTTFTLSLK